MNAEFDFESIIFKVRLLCVIQRFVNSLRLSVTHAYPYRVSPDQARAVPVQVQLPVLDMSLNEANESVTQIASLQGILFRLENSAVQDSSSHINSQWYSMRVH